MSRQVSIPSVLALSLFLFFFLFSPLLLAQQVCYWPDGTEATTHTPCNSSASNTPADASSCCHDLAVSYCQSNNLCTWNGAMYRGACTDKTWRSPNCPQQCTGAQRNTAMNIFPCPAVGVWECERAGQCSSNFTLPAFGILLRDSQLPGNPKEGIGLADPNAPTSSAAAAARATVTVTAGTAPSSAASSATKRNSNALAVGLGVGLPLGLLLVACLALLYRQQRKLKGDRAGTPPLEGMQEKSNRGWGYKRWQHSGGYDAQELPEAREVPELTDTMKSVHELGGHYMPGSPTPPPPPLARL